MSNAVNSTEGATASDQSAVTKAHFMSEIQSMMHGFGDARVPLIESAGIVENIVQQQIKSIINQATDVAVMRGSKHVGSEDIIFLMRRDRVKVHRLLKYLALKDLKSNVTGMMGDTCTDPEVLLESASNMKRTRTCTDFLNSIDQTGELTDSSTLPVDIVKYERSIRAERSSRNLDETSYLEFVAARRTSFVNTKSAPKFREWLRMKPEVDNESPKIINTAYDLLGYLAYETVAQIVDLALLVRQDNMLQAGQPFSRYVPGIGYSVRDNLHCRQIETALAITPAEIREALRRFWNSPFGPSALFTHNHSSNFQERLLSL